MEKTKYYKYRESSIYDFYYVVKNNGTVVQIFFKWSGMNFSNVAIYRNLNVNLDDSFREVPKEEYEIAKTLYENPKTTRYS